MAVGGPVFGQTPAQPPGELPAVPAVPASEPPRLNRFELLLDDGGTVVGAAGRVELRGERPDGQEGPAKAILSGGVEILYQDVKITADRIELDRDTEDVVATGGVVFDQGPRRLVGSRLELNLETKLGAVDDVTGFVSTDYFFAGSHVAKTGENTYRIDDGRFSSCEGESPAWSFRAKRIVVTVDGYAKARSASFRVRKAPLFYLPYVAWPVNQGRTSGLLMPKPGYSSRRGATLGLGYFQTLGRSYDTTFHVDFFGGGAPRGSAGNGKYFGLGNEFRYRPSQGTAGQLQAYFIHDPELDDLRWKIRLDHESNDLPLGFRGVIQVDEVSDFAFFQDYERRVDRNSQRQLYSFGFVSKNWGHQSLNIQFDSRETLLTSDRTITQRQLPEVEYKLRSTRLGKTPLYLQMRSSVHLLDVDRGAQANSTYGRADVFPEVTLPIRARPWMSLSLTAGGRFTWWQDSLRDPQASSGSGELFAGEGLSRFVPNAEAEIVGPTFSKIFDNPGGKNWSKFKHVIEPRFTYAFFEDFVDQDRVPIFDEVDNVRGSNIGRVALVNRLLAKPAGESGDGAREIMSFELYQDVSLDSTVPLQASRDRSLERQQGPLTGLFRYNPSRRTTVKAEVGYSTLFSAIEETSLSATFGIGSSDNIGLRWARRLSAEDGIVRNDQVRLSTQLTLVPRRLTFSSQVNYDIERAVLQFQRHILSFQGSCYGLSIESGEYRRGDLVDREFRFLVTLKNVGTFLDITGGASETL